MLRTKKRKRLLWFAGAIPGIFGLAVAAIFVQWLILAGPAAGRTAFSRFIRNGMTRIDDFKHYPSRILAASASPHSFSENRGVFRAPPAVEFGGGSEANLEDLLASTDTIAFLVVKGDEIVIEQYFQGHTASSLSQFFSVTKSFTSALVGKAIDDGFIRSIDQPVTDFVPELAQAGFEAVTIEHLLTMSSGSNYVENDNPFGVHPVFNYTSDLERMILKFRLKTEPGQQFQYKSGDTALLGLILSRALAPMTVTDYAQDRFWTPLGMEHEGVWSLDREGGLEKNWCCLAASARDLARFGSLYLNWGMWEGQRLLPEEWVRQSTQVGAFQEDDWPRDYKDIGLRNYGRYWWLASQEDGDYLALGKDGQYLYINPSKDVVIVRLGWRQGELPTSQWLKLFQFLTQEVQE